MRLAGLGLFTCALKRSRRFIPEHCFDFSFHLMTTTTGTLISEHIKNANKLQFITYEIQLTRSYFVCVETK